MYLRSLDRRLEIHWLRAYTCFKVYHVKRSHWLVLVSAIAILVFLDAATKWIVQTHLEPGQVMLIAGRCLRVTFTPNYSGFSWWVPQLPSWAGMVYQLVLVLLLIAAFPFYQFFAQTRGNTRCTDISFICIVSACLGHLVGDITQSYTTDFIQVLRMPVFNLADVYTWVGIGALVVVIVRAYRGCDPSQRSFRELCHSLVAAQREFIDFLKKCCRS